MASGGPVQQINALAQPVLALDPPPEGQMVASVPVTLTSSIYQQTLVTALNQRGGAGVAMSQVCTLLIDNSENSQQLTVVHGVEQLTTLVPASGGAIIPTTSSKGGSYIFEVSTPNAPSQDIPIGASIYNYRIPPQIWGIITVQNTIVNSTHNSEPLYSNTIDVAASVGTTQLLAPGNYILDSIDLAVEYAAGPAIGTASIQVILEQSGGEVIHAFNPACAFPSGGGVIAGPQVNSASYRTWPQGLMLTRGQNVQLKSQGKVNLTNCLVRVNISGYNAP